MAAVLLARGIPAVAVVEDRISDLELAAATYIAKAVNSPWPLWITNLLQLSPLVPVLMWLLRRVGFRRK